MAKAQKPLRQDIYSKVLVVYRVVVSASDGNTSSLSETYWASNCNPNINFSPFLLNLLLS